VSTLIVIVALAALQKVVDAILGEIWSRAVRLWKRLRERK
jgi:hypothetical protein